MKGISGVNPKSFLGTDLIIFSRTIQAGNLLIQSDFLPTEQLTREDSSPTTMVCTLLFSTHRSRIGYAKKSIVFAHPNYITLDTNLLQMPVL